jgi:hypothetical protein
MAPIPNSQIHKAINHHPFKEAGISGFLPLQPFRVPAKFINVSSYTDFWWPTLSELNDDIKEFPGLVMRNAAIILGITHHSAHLLCTQAFPRNHQCRHMFLNIPHHLLHPWHR